MRIRKRPYISAKIVHGLIVRLLLHGREYFLTISYLLASISLFISDNFCIFDKNVNDYGKIDSM